MQAAPATVEAASTSRRAILERLVPAASAVAGPASPAIERLLIFVISVIFVVNSSLYPSWESSL
jgi:hypothetical protein